MLPKARVIQQLVHAVGLVPAPFAIAVSPVSLVRTSKPPHATIDRRITEDRAELRVGNDAFTVVAHEHVPSASGGEQFSQRVRSVATRTPRAPLVRGPNETGLAANGDRCVEPPARDDFRDVIVARVLTRVVRWVHVQ